MSDMARVKILSVRHNDTADFWKSSVQFSQLSRGLLKSLTENK